MAITWRATLLRLAVALAAAASVAAAAAGEPASLESVCADKEVALERISQARSLIDESRGRQVAGCEKFAESLAQLDGILTNVQSGAICNLALVDKIRAYHEAFVDASGGGARPIPRSVRDFFIALCFQISAECKMALINNLEYDTRELITDDDYAQIKFLERYGATLLDADSELSDFDDVLLLTDLALASDMERETGETRMLVKVKTNDMLRKLIGNCENKFKPFYDKLIMPLIKLSNLGYNYQGELLERELEELKHNALVKRWYNIVQTCEIFRSIEVFEDPEIAASQATSDDQRQMLTFISEDEAAQLRERRVKSLNEEVAPTQQQQQQQQQQQEAAGASAQKLTYEPVASHNDDELWIRDQRELAKLVAKYKASASEADRVRRKILRKMLARIKDTLKSGKIFVLASELMRAGPAPTSSLNEDMLAMMDEAVEEDELSRAAQGRGQRALSSEAPVALGPKSCLLGLAKGGPGRGIVSKLGPKARVTDMGVPARAKYIRAHTDGTKLSTKWFNFTNSFLPRKMSIFMWIIGIVGLLLIISSVIIG